MKTIIRCAIAGSNCKGEADMYFVKVCGTSAQIERQLHLDYAIDEAKKNGFYSVMVYDENDPVGPSVMTLFNWESSPTIMINEDDF